MHQTLDDSDQTRKYSISESIIQALIMTNCHNVGLVRVSFRGGRGGAFAPLARVSPPLVNQVAQKVLNKVSPSMWWVIVLSGLLAVRKWRCSEAENAPECISEHQFSKVFRGGGTPDPPISVCAFLTHLYHSIFWGQPCINDFIEGFLLTSSKRSFSLQTIVQLLSNAANLC